MNDVNRLRRPLQPMPDFIRQAMVEKGLMDAYINRPPYQRNDYLSWIIRAKQEKTRQKRLNQMLDELAAGNSYMNMKYKAKSV
jgi:uncharacterized protein YdeI (YjbR/CyaY-like superfamily)